MTTITIDRATVEQALEALGSSQYPQPRQMAAITNLRAALTQQAEPRNQCGETCERAKLCATCAQALAQQVEPVEPVAWMVYAEGGTSAYVTDNPTDLVGAYRALPLYATPPQREPLTDEEIEMEWSLTPQDEKREGVYFARRIERAHGIGEEK